MLSAIDDFLSLSFAAKITLGFKNTFTEKVILLIVSNHRSRKGRVTSRYYFTIINCCRRVSSAGASPGASGGRVPVKSTRVGTKLLELIIKTHHHCEEVLIRIKFPDNIYLYMT